MKLTLLCLLGLISLRPAISAQTVSRDSGPVAVIQQLFAAMHAGDTAATRAVFANSARVMPVQPDRVASTLGQGLSVDQFVAFAGSNPSGSWNERIWSPVEHVSGALADLWFEYDVFRGPTFDHCGVNAVQLQQTSSGWKIVSMAFTSVRQGCAPHQPPV